VAKKALGKGLAALISEDVIGNVNTSASKNNMPEIDVNQLSPDPDQPRTKFDKNTLRELAASIKEQGVLQPILVQQVKNGYQIIAGERRWRAAKLAGLKKVPVIIRDVNIKDKQIISLIENLHREELNAIEQAKAYQQIINDSKITQETLAHMLGKDRATISNTIRLLSLNDELQKEVMNGVISMGHARALLAIKDKKQRLIAGRKVVKDGLSVRDVERFSQAQKSSRKKQNVPRGTSGTGAGKSAEIQSLESEMREILSTKVSIREISGKKGSIEIEYYSLEDLDRILSILRK
jgi:ParB family chromosome partitioning protein